MKQTLEQVRRFVWEEGDFIITLPRNASNDCHDEKGQFCSDGDNEELSDEEQAAKDEAKSEASAEQSFHQIRARTVGKGDRVEVPGKGRGTVMVDASPLFYVVKFDSGETERVRDTLSSRVTKVRE